MPAKKKETKKTPKKGAKKKTPTKKTKKEIKKAVKELPALILEEKAKIREEKKTRSAPQKHIPVQTLSPQKRTWLWGGTILCTILVFVLWVMNINATFSNFKEVQKASEEKALFDQSKKDLYESIERVKKEEQETMKEEVETPDLHAIFKETFEPLLEEINTATSSLDQEIDEKEQE